MSLRLVNRLYERYNNFKSNKNARARLYVNSDIMRVAWFSRDVVFAGLIVPYNFWPRANLFRKTRDGASSQNSTRKSRGRSHNKMPTNIAFAFSKFVYQEVALISFGFKTCIDRIQDPTLLHLI